MKNVNTTYVDVTIIRGHVPVGIGLVSAFIWLIAKESSVGSVSNFDGKEITINQVCQIKTRNLISVLRTASRVQYIHSYTSITGKYIQTRQLLHSHIGYIERKCYKKVTPIPPSCKYTIVMNSHGMLKLMKQHDVNKIKKEKKKQQMVLQRKRRP